MDRVSPSKCISENTSSHGLGNEADIIVHDET